ncbi:MAG: ATP-dependent helicase [Nostocoides sp.]
MFSTRGHILCELTMAEDILERFSPATRAWFTGSFTQPTPAQIGAWSAISSGHHSLVVAPTGSGKTLSAFLWAIDRLASAPEVTDPTRRCRVLYLSPMKALAVDVERNLRSPLVGIGHAADRLGVPRSDVTVAVRSGDTPTQERRTFARTPSDILITTPESLFLMLTSSLRENLRGIETVVVDEVHALAGTKRGAHLALSLERLDALLCEPAQRIGLSATVAPVDEVARFLAGGRTVDIVQPPTHKTWDLSVVVPVEDLGTLGEVAAPSDRDPLETSATREAPSIWPHVEEHVVDLIEQHRTTLVFVNSRRLAERLTSRLNEIWAERRSDEPAPEVLAAHDVGHAGPPAQVQGAAGTAPGAPAVLARAHHGSVSKEQRRVIEDDLKAGRLPAVVATSSLELGIDMGAIDLVIQVESPPSVASGLQRVGRAGHHVGATSRGVFFPKYRGDLVQTAVVVQRMRAGQIEGLAVPVNPLDVLAQQIVAMTAMDDWDIEDLAGLVRRSAPYAGLPRGVLEAVLDMLAGKYPSEAFAELRPRIVWDRLSGVLSGRRGAQRLAVTSGGTIPDRGLFGVFLAAGEGPGRRVGELDEEMVYESRVGDTFTLGTSTWRIEVITHDQVLVSPAPGAPGRLPFWHGEGPGRPAQLGRALGAMVRELASAPLPRAREHAAELGLDEFAANNLAGYVTEQRASTGAVPDDRTVVVERFRDELGDWQVVIHSPLGGQVHAPWALCIAARMRERFGVDVQAMHADDGIVLRLPDIEFGIDSSPDGTGSGLGAGGDVDAEIVDLITLDPAEVREVVTEQLGGSALFASRFRECAARALLLPRRRPDRRQALWQQRQRAAQLLEVASAFPDFPIVLETVRECLNDVFDVPALIDLMGEIRDRTTSVIAVETPAPSPFARSLLFGYIGHYVYEGDSPLAERRAAALSLDPGLLAELLGTSDDLSLRDLLDPSAIETTYAQLQRMTPQLRCRDAEDLADLLRWLGPLTDEAIADRSIAGAPIGAWLAELVGARRILTVRLGEDERHAAIEDAARLRDAVGTQLPPGIPEAFLLRPDDPVGDLVRRYARTHTPFTAAGCARWWGVGVAVVTEALRRLEGTGQVISGHFLPLELAPEVPSEVEFCDAEVLRLIRRRSLAVLRAEVEPVGAADYARFLPSWQGVGADRGGMDALLRVVEQLAGAVLPASAWEALVLPARIPGYGPALLDEAMASRQVIWQGHGALAGSDGWVSLHPTETAALTLHPAQHGESGPLATALAGLLADGGAYFFTTLLERLRDGHDMPDHSADDGLAATTQEAVHEALWQLVWQGRVAGDTFAPVRALLAAGRSAHRRLRTGPVSVRSGGRHRPLGSLLGSGGVRGRAEPPPTAVGRWSMLPRTESDHTVRAYATAELFLDRYGVLTRGSVVAEDVEGGFAGIYRVLAAAEEAGRIRRGYFVEGLGAAQFGTAIAIDRLRGAARVLPQVPDDKASSPPNGVRALVLAATDPANPWGAALPWPDRSVDAAAPAAVRGHQPGRKSGALVVLLDGQLVLYVERGGRSVLTFTDDPTNLRAAADALASAVRDGGLGRLTVERTDGDPVLGSSHPLAIALTGAGFHATPRGLRIRR